MRGRVRRGFLKSYILKLLGEGEKSGYDLMQTISQETGFWRPSAGSMYPLLQSLEEAGLVGFRTEDRRKTYFLTDKGKLAMSEVSEAREQMRRSIEQSSQVFEKVFGAEKFGHHHHRHRLGDHVPEDIRRRLAVLHRALDENPTLDADTNTRQGIVNLLDQMLALLGKGV
jgi:DNA-binding PadR family transcriptional regulator